MCWKSWLAVATCLNQCEGAVTHKGDGESVDTTLPKKPRGFLKKITRLFGSKPNPVLTEEQEEELIINRAIEDIRDADKIKRSQFGYPIH